MRDGGGAEAAEGGVVVAMLGEVEGVPVLGVGDAEDEVDHFAAAALDLGYCRVCMWVQGGGVLCVQCGLGKYAGTVGECVPDRGTELPEDLPQSLLEFIVDHNVLVHAEVG